MDLRKFLSLTLLISLVPLLITSVVLYIVPEGRVAYWSDWKMLGLSKTQWGDIHINLGWLFLFAGIFHLYLNWRPIVSYMKNRVRELKVFTLEFSFGFLLTLFFIVGTLLGIPPLSTILDFGTSFKEAAAIKYGEPPYGHAERSSLESLARRTGLDVDRVLGELERAELVASGKEQTLLEVARVNNKTPKEVWMVAQQARVEAVQGGVEPFPDSPFPGFGRQKLIDICTRYDLDTAQVIELFQENGMVADETKTIKEIAAVNNSDPHHLFEIIHGVAH